jgi:hypothetical protein
MRFVEGVIDFGTAEENHVDGVSGIYRISQNTIVMRHTWDRVDEPAPGGDDPGAGRRVVRRRGPRNE